MSPAGLPLTATMFGIAIKRRYDFGLPGSLALPLLVPMIASLWLVALTLIPGKARPIVYGPAPAFQPD